MALLKINVREFRKGNTSENSERAIKMDNPDKLATQGTQDEETQNKKQNRICIGHHYVQINTNNMNKS
jgi:hypothetical protein